MGINFGAALGAAAQSGINTYTRLGEEQRQEEELAMRRKEADYQEEQRQQERELNKITALTLGGGDKRTVADQSTVNQGYEGADGPAATGYKEVAYTPQQQMADFKQRALAAGVPMRKVTETAALHRADKEAEAQQLAIGFNRQVMDDIRANPNNLGAVFDKHFKGLYNEGKLPGLNDGKTAEVVPAATGGQSIVLRDAKGKATKTIPLDINTIEALTKKWTNAMMRDASPSNWLKYEEQDLKREQLDIEREYKGKGGIIDRAYQQRAGAGGEKTLKARTAEYAEAVLDAKTKNPATNKPYTPEEAKLYAFDVLTKNPNVKAHADWKAVSGNPDLQENAQGVQREWDAKANTWKIRGVPPISENAAKLNVTADIRDGQVGYRGKNGWYTSEQEAVDSYSAAPGAAPAKPNAALPTGSRAELRATADKIDTEIAALRKGVTARTPVEQRAAIGKQIDALQAQRSDTLKAWAKTPGMAINTEAAFPMPRP